MADLVVHEILSVDVEIVFVLLCSRFPPVQVEYYFCPTPTGVLAAGTQRVAKAIGCGRGGEDQPEIRIGVGDGLEGEAAVLTPPSRIVEDGGDGI
jgi:hypothetical protein